MSAQLAQLQEDRNQYQEQLDLVIISLKSDADNAELLALKEELQSALEIIDESMSELKTAAKNDTVLAAASQYEKEKSHHPQSTGYKDGADDEAPVVYKVNESILARWVSGDKSFYPARIMSVTGSATAPMYTVKFKSYDTIETLRARDVRPLASATPASGGGTKRKADSTTAESTTPASPITPAGSSTPTSTSQPPPPPSNTAVYSQSHGQLPPPPPISDAPAPPHPTSAANVTSPPLPPSTHPSHSHTFSSRTIDRFSSGVVSSAAAQLYPQALQQQQQGQQRRNGSSGSTMAAAAGAATSSAPLEIEDEAPRKKYRKIETKKKLEAGKSKWQEFNSKGKTSKAGGKKDSMFRTPEGVHGRVGFTGSGQTMRKDVTRSRHIYQTNDDLD